MKTENKEFFMDNVEAANTGEEEIVLAPPAELLDEAKEIAQRTKSEEKYPFTLHLTPIKRIFCCRCCRQWTRLWKPKTRKPTRI